MKKEITQQNIIKIGHFRKSKHSFGMESMNHPCKILQTALMIFLFIILSISQATAASGCLVPTFSHSSLDTSGWNGYPGGGVEVADFNSDGKTDVVNMANGDKVRIFWGDGAGQFNTFVDLYTPVYTFPVGLFVIDVNNDGKKDIAVRKYDGNLYIFLGNGMGGFSQPVSTALGANWGANGFGDFDGDGMLDIVNVNQFQTGISFLRGNNSGTFTFWRQISPSQPFGAILVADFDQDNQPDILTTKDNNVAIYYNNNGNFDLSLYSTGQSAGGLKIADINGDNRPDIIITSDTNIFTLFNNGNEAFGNSISSPGFPEYQWGVRDIADMDGDGNLDIVGGGYHWAYTISFGDGQGHFTMPIIQERRYENTLGVVAANLNNLVDNRPDIIFTGIVNDIHVYLHSGFVSEQSLWGLQDIALEATSPTGATYNYPAANSGYPLPFGSAAPSFSVASGSFFQLGTTTTVTWSGTDSCGNATGGSFHVSVVDTTAPSLSLPPYISTNATSAAGATVTYFASADDIVSGQLPATCAPASGSTSPIGQTTVNCSATDGAGNTSTGSFDVFVLTGDQIFTPAEYYLTLQPNNILTIAFQGPIESPGVTTVQPIDAATLGTTPAGFALSNGIAYQISTTAGVYFDNGVELIFAVPGPISETDFNNLRILHNNNGTLEDVTSGYGYNPETQSGNIHAYTYSFSPFYLAKKVDIKVAPLFNQTHAFKAGSAAPIKIQLLNDAGGNVSSAATVLKARNLVRLGSNSTSVVIDSGNANPDLNFRYDSNLRGYIFNLKTTGLSAGKYALSFYAGNDQKFFYTVEFQVK